MLQTHDKCKIIWLDSGYPLRIRSSFINEVFLVGLISMVKIIYVNEALEDDRWIMVIQ